MSEMANSLRNMFDHMKSRKEEKAHEGPSKQKLPEDVQERAIAILEDDGLLSDNEFMEVVDHFIDDRNFARVYATLRTRHTRTQFLQRRLKKIRLESSAATYEESL